jgi:hypothetical protein
MSVYLQIDTLSAIDVISIGLTHVRFYFMIMKHVDFIVT